MSYTKEKLSINRKTPKTGNRMADAQNTLDDPNATSVEKTLAGVEMFIKLSITIFFLYIFFRAIV